MALWTAEVFVNSDVGNITATVESSTINGARDQIQRIYGPVQQIVNLREVSSGGGSSSGGSSIGGLFFLVVIGSVASIFSGGEGGDSTTPPPAPTPAPIERVVPAPAPVPAPEPMFQDYPTPPPSYCITENFEPC